MSWIDNIIFALATVAAFGLFAWQMRRVMANINLGLAHDRKDRAGERLNRMLLVAFGQQKMFKKPLPAVLHAFIYVGFLLINIELLEIIVDGVAGTHRFLSFLGPVYSALMATNEVLGALVVVACVILLYRRNVLKVRRFQGAEMQKWPVLDANIILVTEIVLMCAHFAFNAADVALTHAAGAEVHGVFPVSAALASAMPSLLANEWIMHIGWWGHILGIYALLNYIPISKHFHIIMAFPNVYTSKLEPKGQLDNVDYVTNEVRAMLNPAAATASESTEIPRLGARDVVDLPWTNLMDAYTCTECGRCTDQCPANITGKKLSPRKIIMDTRDRLESLKALKLDTPDKVKAHADTEGKYLLGAYISPEELWACTTCNACTEACPVNIDHVSEIIALRRYMVMEEASAPQELNIMLTNIQNNGAPWAMSSSNRFNWADGIQMPAAKIAAQA
jgi:heterodisulfide reductase subunit C